MDNRNIEIAKQITKNMAGLIISVEENEMVTIMACFETKEHPVLAAVVSNSMVYLWDGSCINNIIELSDVTITDAMREELSSSNILIENGPSYQSIDLTTATLNTADLKIDDVWHVLDENVAYLYGMLFRDTNV